MTEKTLKQRVGDEAVHSLELLRQPPVLEILLFVVGLLLIAALSV
jgi:hypothetical protein